MRFRKAGATGATGASRCDGCGAVHVIMRRRCGGDGCGRCGRCAGDLVDRRRPASGSDWRCRDHSDHPLQRADRARGQGDSRRPLEPGRLLTREAGRPHPDHRRCGASPGREGDREAAQAGRAGGHCRERACSRARRHRARQWREDNRRWVCDRGDCGVRHQTRRTLPPQGRSQRLRDHRRKPSALLRRCDRVRARSQGAHEHRRRFLSDERAAGADGTGDGCRVSARVQAEGGLSLSLRSGLGHACRPS